MHTSCMDEHVDVHSRLLALEKMQRAIRIKQIVYPVEDLKESACNVEKTQGRGRHTISGFVALIKSVASGEVSFKI